MNELLESVARTLEITVKTTGAEELRNNIIQQIRELIVTDMQKLIAILYRLDIDEKKLVTLLQEAGDADSAVLITDLILEREARKIKSRRDYGQRDNDISEVEKW